ncbi:lysophosphatidylcholine acyltransferase 2 [Takifugu rubripes]|uniref:Lysophosphatidylcholine acyltransferase 2 n=1 Tax=Takifugu rubripes TaxID=31033 RepID=H2TQX3_TAKRU|nr:lysophosphatidylcholine acyltransferase 2 [Takifugu rubripes]|eukprot:XP_003969581.1 PREDICTED: lysophosphatidylcholine acyltransferase 2 [Takifugu rubripes]
MPPQRVSALPRQQSLLLPAVINPFVQDTKLSKSTVIKCVLLGIVLVPVRAILMSLVLMVTWPVALIITLNRPLKGAVEPMKGWRQFMCRRVMTALGRAYFFCMGFRVVIKGTQVSSSEAPILAVAPHSTFFDGIVCIVAGLPSTVSRVENLATPIFGRLVRCLQPVLVSRKDPDSRKNTIQEIESRAKSAGHWPQVLIFPEGTCTNRSCLITFKQGAFIPGVPVQPVLMRYPNTLDTVTWTWQGFGSRALLLLTLSQLYTTVEIEFLPPQIPTEEEKKTPALFACRVRQAMAQALRVPVTDHTYEDCRLMISAGELTLPMEAGLVEFTKISRKLNLKWDNMRKELESFAAMASSCRGGRITIEEFAHFLKLPVSSALEELFSLFDRNGDGTIDFREYVIGVTILCRPANTEDVLQMAFQLFDTDGDERITREEFTALLRSALGVSDINMAKLFKEIDADASGFITFNEFQAFAITHPEYAKLFTTYLELQRYQAIQEASPGELELTGQASLRENQEDSISDKKDD